MLRKRRGRALDLRTRGAGVCGSWIVPIVMIFAATATSVSGISASYCCPENTTWINPSVNCSDGSKIRLFCREGESFYSLDPEFNHFDEFTVEDIGGHPTLEFLHDHQRIVEGRFCLSGKSESDRWALVCFDEVETYNAPPWRVWVFAPLCLISVFFLIVTMTVYATLPELREIQDKSMSCVVGFLAASYLILAIEQMRSHPEDDHICVPLAFFMYWTFLSAFFWMNLVAFNVWRSVWFKNFPIKDKDLFLIFCAIGFVGPGIFLIGALAAHHTDGYHLKPGFGERGCWFGGNSETWAFFYGPIAALLTLNVMYLGLTCWRLWVDYRGYTGTGLRSLRYNCLLYVKLVLVMGITWIFEVISFAASPSGAHSIWLATDVLNSLQGVLIFILLVLTRRRVKRLLARRKPCGMTFPKSWAAYEEDGEVAPALDVEMELSNSP